MVQYPQRAGEPDCRDFLRTGRCKYGESCKYHHPANVQSGGGFKSLDPNEPPFPLRPNEPNCQYYMKHGTCKFGQTCKFHHPSHLMNKGQGNPQFQCLPAPGPAIGSDVIVLLPQRPNEPDCIYYLRNGRCKYGSTCKFHHPLTYQSVNVGGMHDNMALVQQQHQDFTRRQTQRGRSFSTSDMNIVNNSSHMPIPLVASQSVLANQQHNQGHSGPTHILVPMLNPPLNKGNSSFHSNTNNSFLSHRSAPQGSITQPV